MNYMNNYVEQIKSRNYLAHDTDQIHKGIDQGEICHSTGLFLITRKNEIDKLEILHMKTWCFGLQHYN